MQYYAIRITNHNRRIVELLDPSLDFDINRNNWLLIDVEGKRKNQTLSDGGFKSRFGMDLNYHTINIHHVKD